MGQHDPGSVLRLPLDLKQTVKQNLESALRTLADADREHILETLKHTDCELLRRRRVFHDPYI
jgi:hypothetical protein